MYNIEFEKLEWFCCFEESHFAHNLNKTTFMKIVKSASGVFRH